MTKKLCDLLTQRYLTKIANTFVTPGIAGVIDSLCKCDCHRNTKLLAHWPGNMYLWLVWKIRNGF